MEDLPLGNNHDPLYNHAGDLKLTHQPHFEHRGNQILQILVLSLDFRYDDFGI